MDIEKAKQLILTYVQQFDTDAAIGLMVDRTRRSLLRRISPYKVGKAAYDELLAADEIHEIGDGHGNSPIMVAIGPKPTQPPLLSAYLDTLTLATFSLKILDVYDKNGWTTTSTTIQSEIKKALEAYTPGRPY